MEMIYFGAQVTPAYVRGVMAVLKYCAGT